MFRWFLFFAILLAGCENTLAVQEKTNIKPKNIGSLKKKVQIATASFGAILSVMLGIFSVKVFNKTSKLIVDLGPESQEVLKRAKEFDHEFNYYSFYYKSEPVTFEEVKSFLNERITSGIKKQATYKKLSELNKKLSLKDDAISWLSLKLLSFRAPKIKANTSEAFELLTRPRSDHINKIPSLNISFIGEQKEEIEKLTDEAWSAFTQNYPT